MSISAGGLPRCLCGLGMSQRHNHSILTTASICDLWYLIVMKESWRDSSDGSTYIDELDSGKSL